MPPDSELLHESANKFCDVIRGRLDQATRNAGRSRRALRPQRKDCDQDSNEHYKRLTTHDLPLRKKPLNHLRDAEIPSSF
jgi:hypothetical protein